MLGKEKGPMEISCLCSNVGMTVKYVPLGINS